MRVGLFYKCKADETEWECVSRSKLNNERFALLKHNTGVVWFTSEIDWINFEEI